MHIYKNASYLIVQSYRIIFFADFSFDSQSQQGGRRCCGDSGSRSILIASVGSFYSLPYQQN